VSRSHATTLAINRGGEVIVPSKLAAITCLSGAAERNMGMREPVLSPAGSRT